MIHFPRSPLSVVAFQGTASMEVMPRKTLVRRLARKRPCASRRYARFLSAVRTFERHRAHSLLGIAGFYR